MNKRVTLNRMIFAAMFSALIFIGTYLFKIPTTIGYIHLGDGLVFIAAAILPLPYAIAAAAIGGGLSDLISGFIIWIPATVLIKGLCTVLFSSTGKRMLCARNVIAVAFAAFVNIAGYYFYETVFCGSFVSPLAEIPLNLIQEAAGAALFVIVAVTLDANPKMKDFYSRKIRKR